MTNAQENIPIQPRSERRNVPSSWEHAHLSLHLVIITKKLHFVTPAVDDVKGQVLGMQERLHEFVLPR
jgi:hypothetical protein